MLKENHSGPSDNRDSSDSNGRKPTPIQFTDTVVSHRTPVLFSTNRGLFLRKVFRGGRCSSGSKNSEYELNFCDLERWSTNRANSVCLNDTINSQTYSLCNQNRPSVRFATVERDIRENYESESADN